MNTIRLAVIGKSRLSQLVCRFLLRDCLYLILYSAGVSSVSNLVLQNPRYGEVIPPGRDLVITVLADNSTAKDAIFGIRLGQRQDVVFTSTEAYSAGRGSGELKIFGIQLIFEQGPVQQCTECTARISFMLPADVLLEESVASPNFGGWVQLEIMLLSFEGIPSGLKTSVWICSSSRPGQNLHSVPSSAWGPPSHYSQMHYLAPSLYLAKNICLGTDRRLHAFAHPNASVPEGSHHITFVGNWVRG